MHQRSLPEPTRKLPAQELQNQTKRKKRIVIPRRFSQRIDAHLLGNMLDIEQYPLIMVIIGQSGMGKTYQLRKYLEAVGVHIFSVSAVDLENDRAGEPAKLLQQKYVEASSFIAKGNPSILLIDDIDMTLGEWEKNTGTVNHQDILAFLMHIADNPYFIENVGKLNRVPIFFTGNNFDILYKPLVRSGRAILFDWAPNRKEKIEIIASIFSFDNIKNAEKLIDAYPTKEISFFSNMLASESIAKLALIANNVAFKRILTDENYKSNLYAKYYEERAKIDWTAYAAKSLSQQTD